MPTIAELKAALTDPRYYAEVGQGLLDSFNRGAVGGLLGTPVDMANGVVNAGKMAAGYVGHKTGLLSPGQMPQPDTAPIGGSEWWGQKMQDAGMVSGNRNIPAEMLMGIAGIPLTGAAAAKVMPKVEQGLLTAAKNAVNPATLNVPAYGGQRGAIVWHGTPHKFDKFDMSKIGTGEGAQAYGHGLYMSDSPTVARTYQAKVSDMQGAGTPTINGKPINWDNPKEYAAFEISRHNGDVDAAKQFYSKTFRVNNNVLDAFSSKELPKIDMPGQLYKVDIPDEAVARFLDWDKPLSQQAPEVQKALKKSQFYKDARLRFKETGQWYDDPAQKTGEGLLKYLRSGTTDIAGGANQYGLAEDYLKSQGIPGIRYLDGGSRGEGQGTSNFVLFSDDLARILERNGAPTGLEPWKPGEWSAK